MKNSFFVLLFIFSSLKSFCQHVINYGENRSAGKYYDVRGIKMYVEEYGKGVPLLLIHGNGGNISAFKENIPFFSSKYRVIATDSRAQGKSIDTKDSISFEMMADDESTLLDIMHIDSAYVLGWSDGGIVALVMAMRHPEKIIRLASTGANLWPDSTAIDPSTWRNDKVYYDSSKNKIFTNIKDRNDWKIFMLDWTQPNISLSELQKIKCPSLIIAGDHDVITPEHTVKIYQNISHANLWIIPNSGHGTLIEHKDEFNKKVYEFFSTSFQAN